MKIQQNFTVVGYPQANGQTKVTNRILLQYLKILLEECKSYWVDELPGVLWAYRTTPRSTIGETPFYLVYESEVVILVEIGEATLQIIRYKKEVNDETWSFNLEVVKEKSDQVQMLKTRNTIINDYRKKVKNNTFQVGDLVLKKGRSIEAYGQARSQLER